MEVLKRKDFARWQRGEALPDAALCKAVLETEQGLVGAGLGGALYKKRVARPGGGKRGGYRTLLAFRALGAVDLAKALNSGVLVEVRCEEQNH